jgi:N-methylhydantoinase B
MADRLTRLDPIAFEILRHRLWAINAEAATTVRLVSGSPVATESNDMNTSLMNAAGDVFVVGAYSLAKATTMSDVVKDILEQYRDNPGIRPGDAFISNDPYLGVQHQNDVAFVMPIFWDDELLAWAGAEIHQVDVGGPTAGQVQFGAKDIFGEAPVFPPVRILEGGVLRRDLEREYLRRSRVPELVGLDLRAKVAACNVSSERIRDLVGEYGLETVRAAFEDILDYAEFRFRGRLRDLPDGTWRNRSYLDYDGRIYPIVVAMTKRGDTLTFDFRDTGPQAPAVINCTRKALVAVIRGYLCPALCWDFPWCPAGVGRAVEILTRPGTLVDPTWPAGMSKSTTSAIWNVGKTVGVLVGRMLVCHDEMRRKAMAAWQGATTVEDIFGTDQRGRPFGGALLDGMAGGGGARTWRDGIDTGGYFGSMSVSIANVESYEFEYPILYLYRRQNPDSGGAGTFRGGAGITKMYTVHDVDELAVQVMHCVGAEVPLSPGVSGGYPSITNRFLVRRGTDIQADLARGAIPQALDALGGTLEVHPGISRTSLKRGDVYQAISMGGGGYGDPLERDPDLVRRDVQSGLVTLEGARRMYGVILDPGGATVDAEGTARQRRALRDERRRAAGADDPAPDRLATPPVFRLKVNEYLGIVGDGQAAQFACRCGALLGPAAENYKLHALEARYPLTRIGPAIRPALLGSAPFELREYYCPGCAILFEAEVARKGDPVLWDTEVRGRTDGV